MSVVNEVIEILNSMKIGASTADPAENTTSAMDNEAIETAEKLRIFKSLPIIAKQIGAEETKKNLLPVISNVTSRCLNVADDEVLLVIAQKLGDFYPLVGEGENLAPVVAILEKMLYKIEEILVAQAIAGSFVKIIPHLSPNLACNTATNLVRTLVGEDLYCSCKKVLPEIMVALYPHVNARLQQDLRFRFMQYADFDEEVPIVRVAFVLNLVPLMKAVGPEIKSEMINLVNSLITDCERTIRAACVSVLIELGNMCTQRNEVETVIIPLLEKLTDDNCRDVKRAIVKSISDWQKLLQKHGIHQSATKPLHVIMLNLLEDNEVETRRISATHLEEFCLVSPPEVLNANLLPSLREHLVREREERVRAELVRTAVKLLSHLNRDEALPLVKLIMAFLNENGAQAKQYVFEHFQDMIKLLTPSEIQNTLLPNLLRLWTDKNWRVRLGVVQSVPMLFDLLPEDVLKDTMLVATLAWLRDPTCTVRECACRSLGRLLRACPAAIPDALNGTGQNTAKAACAKAFGGLSAMSTNQNTSGETNSNTTGTGVSSEENAGSMSMANIESLAFLSAKGGLKALATDSNYHLRKIYTIAIQTIWGPGIPDEPPFSAAGGETNLGVVNGPLNTVKEKIERRELQIGQVPKNCSAPVLMPVNQLQQCVQQIMRLMSEDPVPNVRFSAARTLFFISAQIDKKKITTFKWFPIHSLVNAKFSKEETHGKLQLLNFRNVFGQKDVVPSLKNVVASDSDSDVTFYAQETLALFE